MYSLNRNPRVQQSVKMQLCWFIKFLKWLIFAQNCGSDFLAAAILPVLRFSDCPLHCLLFRQADRAGPGINRLLILRIKLT